MTKEKIQSLYRWLETDNRNSIKKVFEFAKEHLGGIFRRTGEDYATHGIDIALTLKECSNDPTLIRVAILHDLFMNPEGEAVINSAPLNDDEKWLVQKMYELRRLNISEKTTDLDVVINSIIQDPRLLTLRMAHRLHDVRNLNKIPGKLKKIVAHESLHMYSAIAGRLGMESWKYEMEDICFKELHKNIADNLINKFGQMEGYDQSCLDHASRFLSRYLNKENINHRIEKRIKALYSTYRKIVTKGRKFEDLTDRLAIRIIVEDTMDCYKALGVVHKFMHQMPGKLKDYIGTPKENGYRSIHTVVYPLPGVTQQPIEIQIRSESMHRLCEYGDASHARYKDIKYSLKTPRARVDLFKNLGHLRQVSNSPEDFEKALRNYFNEDQIAVFDHDNHLYHIKKPATALDFICVINPNRYMKVRNVIINGRNMPLDTPLNDGDIVKPEFGRINVVKKDWVDLCNHEITKIKSRRALSGMKKTR